jgi:hypothetical protein
MKSVRQQKTASIAEDFPSTQLVLGHGSAFGSFKKVSEPSHRRRRSI